MDPGHELERLTEPTQQTQITYDPRRMGRNNSGLNNADISDVMCVLHPCSPPAFKVVLDTAARTPQYVLHGFDPLGHRTKVDVSRLEEQETFILDSNGDSPAYAMDLALRFSSTPSNPQLGYVFGRSSMCDIILSGDDQKRISNVHCAIFMNSSGVLMLRDMSTNGTIVDDILLRGRETKNPNGATRMLSSGSVIQIVPSKPHEIVKFILRIPSREGHTDEYAARFQDYQNRTQMAVAKAGLRPPLPDITQSSKVPLVHNQFGMHWSGGDKYNVVGNIGKGAFATVFQLATKSEGALYAAKELEKRKFMKNGILDRKLDNEMQIMKAISHPNIVQYVDYMDHAHHLYIIMEFVPCGDLQQYLSNQGALSEDLGKKMSFQVLDSLAYLHGKKITHRDIKPDNILIANLSAEHFTIKLSDFGLSKVVKDKDTFLKTFCGTLLYCAPEVFPDYDAHIAGRGQKRPRKGIAQEPSKFHSYSQCVDIWSYGAVLWFSLCLKPPFEGVTDTTGRGMFEKIMMTPLDSTDLLEQGISDGCIQLLAEMLNTDPSSRPLPSYCLRHAWFGGNGNANASADKDEDSSLIPIAEEDEWEHVKEPDLSQLRLTEEEVLDADPADEVDIGEDSMEFLNPRESKRFKSNPHTYREPSEAGEMLDSSGELLRESIPIMHQPGPAQSVANAHQPQRKKLFGEISLLDAQPQPVDTLSDPTTERDSQIPYNDQDRQQSQDSVDSGEQARAAVARGSVASPSLLGAESLLRDVHMHGTSHEPLGPSTPERTAKKGGASSTNGTRAFHDDDTPKQKHQADFNRQINLPVPASIFFDPSDPSTHTLEHASKVSGFDFMKISKAAQNASMIVHRYSSETDISLPNTNNGSLTEDDHDTHDEAGEGKPAQPLPSSSALPQATVSHVPEFAKPLPRLGRLVSTPDSFTAITLNLTKRQEIWGRLPINTLVYPDKNDTRVPKRGIFLYFDGEGINNVPDNGDITNLPGLYAGIATESSSGIWINGVHLGKSEPGKWISGRLYTGDEIVVFSKGKSGSGTLKFTAEFFHGESKQQRPKDSLGFVVEVEGGKAKGWKGIERARSSRAE